MSKQVVTLSALVLSFCKADDATEKVYNSIVAELKRLGKSRSTVNAEFQILAKDTWPKGENGHLVGVQAAAKAGCYYAKKAASFAAMASRFEWEERAGKDGKKEFHPVISKEGAPVLKKTEPSPSGGKTSKRADAIKTEQSKQVDKLLADLAAKGMWNAQVADAVKFLLTGLGLSARLPKVAKVARTIDRKAVTAEQ
jgi:hypothetical protein